MMATRLPTGTFFCSTSMYDSTLGCLMPSIGGMRTLMPVATITSS